MFNLKEGTGTILDYQVEVLARYFNKEII